MSTTIDSLVIDIQSTSNNAVGGIERLAGALEKVKKSTISSTAIKNLQGLTRALKELTPVASNASKLGAMADSLSRLSKVGSLNGVINQISRLPEAMRGLSNMNLEGIDDKFEKIALAADKLSQKLGPLSKQMSTIKTGLGNVSGAARKAGSGISDMGKTVKSVNLSSFIFQLQQMYQALAWAIKMLSSFMADAIEWEGIAARFGRGFGAQAEETYAWIQRLNKEMGINVQQFMQYSSVYATMLTGFGVAMEDAGKMALGYTELTYDIWAGYNDVYKNFADAAEAVKSAIAGEVEPVRRAGFTIVESTLKQTAANHGLSISLEKATEAEKSYLRYLTLVDQAHSQGLVGTYAKELSTAEGLMRTLSQQWKSLVQSFGSLFLPILVKIVPYVQALVELLTEAVHWFAALIGVEIQSVDWSGYNKGSAAIDDVANSAAGASGALGSAAKAAKELKNATLGIDELNVISPLAASSGSGGSGSGTGGGGAGGLNVGSLWDETIFDNINSQVDEIKEKLRDWLPLIGLVGAALGALSIAKLLNQLKVFSTIASIVTGIGTAFKFLSDWIKAAIAMAPEVGWFAALFPKLSTALVSLWGVVTKVATAIGTFIGGISAPVWAAIAVAIAAVAAAAYFLYENWEKVVNAVKRFFDENISPKLGEIKKHFDNIVTAIEPFIEYLKVGFGFLADLFVKIPWKKILDIVLKVVEVIGGIIAGTAIGSIIVFISSFISIVENAIQVISGLINFISGAIEVVIGFLDIAISLFGGDGRTVVDVDKFIEGFMKIKDAAERMWQGIKDVFFGLVGIILDPIIEFVTGGIEWFTYMWDELVGHSIVPDMVNGIVEWITSLPGKVLGTIEKFAKDILGYFQGLWDNLASWWKRKPSLAAYTPSIGSIKDKVVSAWNTAKTWWDKSKANLANYTPGIGSIKDKLYTAWVNARSWWDKSKSKLAAYTPSIGSIKDKLSSAWTTAKNWWNKSKGSMSYTPTIGSILNKLKSAWNTAKSWWNKNVKLSIPSLSFKVTYSSKGLNVAQKAIVKALGLDGWPKLSFAANGGIFDQGSLVWAGERGAEIVANAGGGKTGVMNVQQMQDAVYEGVYAAVVAAMRTGGGGGQQAVNVYLDGRQITASVEQRQRERGTSIMGNQVYSY